jgi:hypothetical protein
LVAERRSERDAKYKEFADAEKEVICEENGECSSRRGRGDGFDARVAKRDRLAREVVVAENRFQAAEYEVLADHGKVIEQNVASLERARLRTESVLATRTTVLTTQPDGLQADRVGALFRVGVHRPEVWLLILGIAVFYAFLQTIPVLVRMIGRTPRELLNEDNDLALQRNKLAVERRSIDLDLKELEARKARFAEEERQFKADEKRYDERRARRLAERVRESAAQGEPQDSCGAGDDRPTPGAR